MNTASWVLLVLFLGMSGYAHMLYTIVLDERAWIDALLVDPKATLEALIEMEEDKI